MSSIIDILIKKQELKKVNIEECFVEWGKEKLSQDPKKYTYRSALVFHENTDIDYYADFVKDMLNINELTALTLEGDKLEELDQLVNNGKDIKANSLIIFINELYKKLDTFCLIKLWNEEHIDEIHIINNVFKAINLFQNSLERSSPKGIVIIKK